MAQKPETCAACGVTTTCDSDGKGSPMPPCTGEKGPWFARWLDCPYSPHNQAKVTAGEWATGRPNLCRRKLTDAEVADLRRRRAAGESLKALAAAYGVSATHVSCVCRGTRR